MVEIVRVAHEAGWKTIVGGPEPGAYVNEYLEAGADIVVIGEGEITIEELLPALKDGSDTALAESERDCVSERQTAAWCRPRRASKSPIWTRSRGRRATRST